MIFTILAVCLPLSLTWNRAPAPFEWFEVPTFMISDVMAQITDPTCVGTASLDWTLPTLDTDGLPLGSPITDINVYIGVSPTVLNQVIPLGVTTNYIVDQLCTGLHYFAVTATNLEGESAWSNVASKDIIGGSPIPKEPLPPVLTVT